MMYELLEHVGTGRMVHVCRRAPCECLNGFLLRNSPSLVLMHVFHDFTPGGYVIFRLEDVEEVDRGEQERHFEHMIRGEGLLGGLELGAEIDLSGMSAAIASVSDQYEHLIIECEDAEKDEDDDAGFCVGSVVSATFDRVTFRHFDVCGYWEDKPAEFAVEDITQIEFDTPYIQVFSKYLRSGKRPVEGE